MTVKSYLSQARYLDMRINSKLQQIESLNALATSCTSVLTGMPRNPSHITSRMADCVGTIIDLENEIRNDMNELLDLKRKIMAIIKAVDNPEHQALLEKRYLCYLSWEKIAVDMGYDLRYIHKLHNRALENAKIPELDIKRH